MKLFKNLTTILIVSVLLPLVAGATNESFYFVEDVGGKSVEVFLQIDPDTSTGYALIVRNHRSRAYQVETLSDGTMTFVGLYQSYGGFLATEADYFADYSAKIIQDGHQKILNLTKTKRSICNDYNQIDFQQSNKKQLIDMPKSINLKNTGSHKSFSGNTNYGENAYQTSTTASMSPSGSVGRISGSQFDGSVFSNRGRYTIENLLPSLGALRMQTLSSDSRSGWEQERTISALAYSIRVDGFWGDSTEVNFMEITPNRILCFYNTETYEGE